MPYETSDVVASVTKAVIEADRRKVETSDKLEKLRLKRNEEQRERKRQHPSHAPQLPPDDHEHLIDTVA